MNSKDVNRHFFLEKFPISDKHGFQNDANGNTISSTWQNCFLPTPTLILKKD